MPFDQVDDPPSCPLPLTYVLQRVTVKQGLEHRSDLPKEFGVRRLCVHMCVGARSCAENMCRQHWVGITLICSQLSCCSRGARDQPEVS